MKRLASFLLALLLLLTATGCATNLWDDHQAAVDHATMANAYATPRGGAETLYGDVDGDGKVNIRDLGVLQQHLNGWDVDVVTAAADITSDGKVNVRDLGLLQQHLNGWDVIPGDGNSTTATSAPTTTTTHSAEQRLVDQAFALTGSETLQGTLTGTVVSVKEAYTTHYGNASFTIQVRGTDGVKDLYCYRCTPIGAGEVAVGQSVTVSGTIKNYRGTIEFDKGTYAVEGSGSIVTTTATTQAPFDGTVDENGIYDSAEEVGLYIHIYGKLPKNYVTKSEYNKDKYLCVGGDRFYNKEGRLPSGETYYECDIDTYGITSRGAKRLVWTKSGIVYYTADHYETFTQLYGER